MENYVAASLEVHLFFGRIMKEHSLFLMAGFPSCEKAMISRADWFRQEFEKALESVVQLADGMVDQDVLSSGEVVTRFTELAECQTQKLSGIPINRDITRAEERLQSGMVCRPCRQLVMQVKNLNCRILSLLNGLIQFKENVRREMLSCQLYTTNYPLLLEHIIREASLYRQYVSVLEQRGCLPLQEMGETELFWNRIMMEHAQFIRELLDPTECTLMEKADGFADAYCQLLQEAEKQDRCACESLTDSSLALTKKYQTFKTTGTKGILECSIRSLILPLLADHVLREANHYVRLLQGIVRSV